MALSVSTAVSARVFILKNNTYNWNVKYREALSIDYREGIPEHLLKPGEEVKLNSNNFYSIRRSGFGSTVVSPWADIPIAKLIVDAGGSLNPRPLDKNALATPVVEVSSSLTLGWSFNVVWRRL